MNFSKFQVTAAVIIFLSNTLFAQFLPEDYGQVNYTNIYFEEEFQKSAKSYELSIYENSDALQKGVSLIKKTNALPSFYVSSLTWAHNYLWLVKSYDENKKELTKSEVHNFNIIKQVNLNSANEIKLDIKTNNEIKSNGGYICLDIARTIFDRKGNAIWTLPIIENFVNAGTIIQDLKGTKDNTFTFLTDKLPLEVDINGSILWQAPYPFALNGDTLVYHHDFKKTKWDTYMILAQKKAYRKILGPVSEEHLKQERDVKVVDGVYYKKIKIDVILEFNKKSELIWYWDALDYLKDEDLNFYKGSNGIPIMSSHVNAFSVNENNTEIYIGFRDLSRIIQINKLSKKPEYSYGEKFPSGEAQFANNLSISGQHDATITNHHSILIFNNNAGKGSNGGYAGVIELRDKPKTNENPLLWSFDLHFDTLSNGKSARAGNVVELPNSNLLVCGGALNRVFEVTKSKKIAWDAFVLSRAAQDTAWKPFQQYRTNWLKQINQTHFMYQISSSTPQSKNKMSVGLKIYNTGTLPQKYLIEVYSEKNELLYHQTTKKITNNKGKDFHLIFTNLDTEPKKNIIKISSLGDTNVFKNIIIQAQ